jgi:hypothetical protein
MTEPRLTRTRKKLDSLFQCTHLGHGIYSSQPLTDCSIRLLFIQPSPDRQRQIECTLRPFDFDAIPPYEALSYVWGAHDPSTDEVISCNGHAVSVRQNLGHALRQLRRVDTERIVWIDALSINQRNKDEKSHQVPLMGKIYSQATRTVVWLGHGDAEMISETVRCIGSVGNACSQIKPMPDKPDDYEELALRVETLSPTVVKGLKALYDNAYFTRVWCIQEIRLAHDVTMLWGEQEVSWVDVGRTATWSSYVSNKTSIWPHAIKAVFIFFPATSRFNLLLSLNGYRIWEATDPRDKVYGLLNLVTSKPEVEAMQIDYRKSVAQVYADTVLSTIRLHSSLIALVFVGHLPDYDGGGEFSSWTPRWDGISGSEPMHFVRPHSPSACKAMPVRTLDKTRMSAVRLGLRGILYDSVTVVDSIMYEQQMRNSADSADGHPYGQVAARAARTLGRGNLPAPGNTIIAQWQKLARTLTAGRLDLWKPNSAHAGRSDTGEPENFYLAFTDMMRELAVKPDPHGESTGSSAQSAAPSQYRDLAYRHCNGRRIFQLRNGTYGLGPQCMRAGDVVVVLYGGDYPFVLRPHGDEYLFMGHAYVDDIQNGELVDEVEAGSRQEQEFILI